MATHILFMETTQNILEHYITGDNYSDKRENTTEPRRLWARPHSVFTLNVLCHLLPRVILNKSRQLSKASFAHL